MNFVYIYFLIFLKDIPIFSSEYTEKKLISSNGHTKTYSRVSGIPEENKHTYKPFNMSKKGENLSNSQTLELRADMSKSQCNHTKRAIVKSRSTKFVIALKRLARKKRQFISDRNNHQLNRDLIIRLKKSMFRTNTYFRDDLDNSESTTPKSTGENEETSEGNPQSSTEVMTSSEESPKNESSPQAMSENEVNSENNGIENLHRNETKVIPAITSNSEDDISSDEIWGSMLGDYMTAVLLRLLKDRLNKFNIGKQFWEKVNKISYEKNVDRSTAMQILMNKLQNIFGKKFREKLIALLKKLVNSIKQNLLGTLNFFG
ncbi:uncharacterized protein LOC130677211 isoform X2 [Microplitis mediator]|uniref:uncharacterized protein LOC130677211 isoform X2 n=1 Tax=Microplitis mediator TaxID=375433 RepID=UPI002555166C|nr:uncharacterized protein LOC130677211 isoform X2 [Microplitis mediator]